LTLASTLTLAPAVALMRLPLLAGEARGLDPWRVETTKAVAEKAAALAEGLFAAQLSLAVSVAGFWPEMLSGRVPSILNGVAIERSMHAALAPASRRVEANFRRLSRLG
jgi:hypothetical protein